MVKSRSSAPLIMHLPLAYDTPRQVRVSQPVGTTVRITDFMKNVPVRRQTALKTSTKSIAKIRRLLQAYAYARPSVKFSLKVCKAKNDKSNWIYAPASGDTVLDAAIKICGSRLVDQCQWKVWKSSVEDTSSIIGVETNEKRGTFYKIEALLPSPTCGMLHSGIFFIVFGS